MIPTIPGDERVPSVLLLPHVYPGVVSHQLTAVTIVVLYLRAHMEIWRTQEPTCVIYVRIIIVINAFGKEPEGSQEHASVVIQEVQTVVQNDLLTIE